VLGLGEFGLYHQDLRPLCLRADQYRISACALGRQCLGKPGDLGAMGLTERREDGLGIRCDGNSVTGYVTDHVAHHMLRDTVRWSGHIMGNKHTHLPVVARLFPPLVTLDDADGGDALDPTRGGELPVCHPNAVVVAHHVAGNGLQMRVEPHQAEIRSWGTSATRFLASPNAAATHDGLLADAERRLVDAEDGREAALTQAEALERAAGGSTPGEGPSGACLGGAAGGCRAGASWWPGSGTR